MSKGMSEGQKARLGSHLDVFKEVNGGCLLCKKRIPVAELYYTPEQTDSNGIPLPCIHLHVYGACEAHAMLIDAEVKMEARVEELKNSYKTTEEAGDIKKMAPRLMTVVFSKSDVEEVKWAT
jgi:hypothetical protein